MTVKWHLHASTGSLESLRDLVIKRMYWAECNFMPTTDPSVWYVSNRKGELPTWRVKLKGGRYRLESQA